MTVEKINQAIEKLQSEGIAPDQQKIADLLGVTRQAVQHRLKHDKKLHEYHGIKKARADAILEVLKNLETRSISVTNLYKLVAQQFEGDFITYNQFLYILNKNNIPHKTHTKDVSIRIKTMETAGHSARNIAKELGTDEKYVRRLANTHNLPYKKGVPFFTIHKYGE